MYDVKHVAVMHRLLRCLSTPSSLALAMELADSLELERPVSFLAAETGQTTANVNNALVTLHGGQAGRRAKSGGILKPTTNMLPTLKSEKQLRLDPDAGGFDGLVLELVRVFQRHYPQAVLMTKVPEFDPDDDFDSIDPDDLFPDD